MLDDLLSKIPQWLKSLYEMETALRNAARSGVVLQKDKASEHLAEARRHLEDALRDAKGAPPPGERQKPAPRDGQR